MPKNKNLNISKAVWVAVYGTTGISDWCTKGRIGNQLDLTESKKSMWHPWNYLEGHLTVQRCCQLILAPVLQPDKAWRRTGHFHQGRGRDQRRLWWSAGTWPRPEFFRIVIILVVYNCHCHQDHCFLKAGIN